jgi:hypothetical protein
VLEATAPVGPDGACSLNLSSSDGLKQPFSASAAAGKRGAEGISATTALHGGGVEEESFCCCLIYSGCGVVEQDFNQGFKITVFKFFVFYFFIVQVFPGPGFEPGPLRNYDIHIIMSSSSMRSGVH